MARYSLSLSDLFRVVRFLPYTESSGLFFQAEDGIRYLVRSRGLGDVYKRQELDRGLDLVALLEEPDDVLDLEVVVVVVDVRAELDLSLIHI